MCFYLGIDLGGTTLTASVFSQDFTLMADQSQATRTADGPQAVLRQVAALAHAVAHPFQGKRGGIAAAGLAVPGLIRGENGPVLFAPNVGWKDVDPVLPLQSVLGCPVFLLHDAACAAVAESHFGLGRELASFLFLTLGTAIGGAFIWQGRLFSQHGPFGSELGHISLRGEGIPCSCGLPGCFQQYGSATALARQPQQAARQAGADSALWALCQGQPSQLTAPMVFTAAAKKDPVALAVLDRYTSYLAEGIAGLVNIFRPEAVVLGGGLSQAGTLLSDPVQKKLPAVTHAAPLIGAPPVRCAQLGAGAGALGAALGAAQAAGTGGAA